MKDSTAIKRWVKSYEKFGEDGLNRKGNKIAILFNSSLKY
ncbi:hypothetical protein [Bacillus sp. FJAT-27445]